VCVVCHIQECIPTLASFVSLHRDTAVRVASLQALTNLSVTPAYHRQLVPFADSVVDVATYSTDAKLTLQSLRLLVNLTLSSEFVNYILKEKVGQCHLIDFYDIIVQALFCTSTFVLLMCGWFGQKGHLTCKEPAETIPRCSWIPDQFECNSSINSSSLSLELCHIYVVSNSVIMSLCA